jgi:hypothetical protein
MHELWLADQPEPVDGSVMLRRYLTGQKTRRTLLGYDLQLPQTDGAFTDAEAAATRLMSSRLSRAQARSLQAASTAPGFFDGLDRSADLEAANPETTEGRALYRSGALVYERLAEASPKGVGVAKRHKLMHLRFRHFVPILDSHLCRLYRRTAKDLAAQYPELSERQLSSKPARYTALYWLAVREDLCRNAEALKRLRSNLKSDLSANGLPGSTLDTLSNVRLLDIAAWRAIRQ